MDFKTDRIKRSALKVLLEGSNWEVPAFRVDTSADSNIRWLNRNLRIRNSKHPMFWTAQELIHQILSNSIKKGSENA